MPQPDRLLLVVSILEGNFDLNFYKKMSYFKVEIFQINHHVN